MATNRYCTKNDCYKNNAKLKSVSWLIVHSPAVYPTIIRAESGVGGGWFSRWNKAGVEKLVHGFIDDTGVYEFAPQAMACWHIGNSWGNANCIGYELCELGTKAEFDKVWNNAVNHYASLCKRYGLSADHVIGHQEAHKKGFASDHSDPDPYFERFGKSMSDFRADVKKAMSGQSVETSDKPGVTKTYSPWAYARVTGLTKEDPALNVRSGPGVEYPVVRQLGNDNEVDVVELYSNGWAKINIVGTTGFVNAKYLSVKEAETKSRTVTVVDCNALKVRKTPNGTVIGTVKAGTVLDVLGSDKDSDGDEWVKVKSGNVAGYVFPKYIR